MPAALTSLRLYRRLRWVGPGSSPKAADLSAILRKGTSPHPKSSRTSCLVLRRMKSIRSTEEKEVKK